MRNLLEAAKIIQNALGIESNDIPKTWPKDREQRAAIIDHWVRIWLDKPRP
jgi:hypothetical protein